MDVSLKPGQAHLRLVIDLICDLNGSTPEQVKFHLEDMAELAYDRGMLTGNLAATIDSKGWAAEVVEVKES